MGWGVVEGLEAGGSLEVGEGDAGGDAEGPGAEDGGLAEMGELAEDLEGGLLEDVVCEGGAGEVSDVAAEGGVGVAEELLEGGAVAGLGEEDEQGLAGWGGFLGLGWVVHAGERGRGRGKFGGRINNYERAGEAAPAWRAIAEDFGEAG